MSTSHSTKKKNFKLLRQLTDYMRYKELPRHIQHRVLNYFNFWSNKSVKKDKVIISNVSPNLREVLFFNKYFLSGVESNNSNFLLLFEFFSRFVSELCFYLRQNLNY